MDVLPLPVIGWMFSAGCALALLFGAWLIIGMHYSGEGASRQLASRVLDDSLLFGIWILGLAGGIGVLQEKSWSRPALELFCWSVMVLILFSAWGRLREAVPPRTTLALSIALFVVPLLAICLATIVTLRSETAVRVLAG